MIASQGREKREEAHGSRGLTASCEKRELERKEACWLRGLLCNSLASFAGMVLATLYARKKIPSCDTDVFISRQSVWAIALDAGSSIFRGFLGRETSTLLRC